MTEKKTRNTMSLAVKRDLLNALTDKYPTFGMTDLQFTKWFNATYSTKVTYATVRSYREGLGIAQIKAMTPTELRARINELEARLAARGE